MLGAEVQHLLGFGDAADERAGNAAALGNEVEGVHLRGFGRHAQQNHGAVAAQQVQVSGQVERGRHGVDDEVEVVAHRLQLLLVLGYHELVGPQLLGIGFFVGRGAEHGYFGTHGSGDFHGHVAQAAQAHHAYAVAGAYFPLFQRGIRGDAGAEQRGHAGQVQLLRYFQGVLFVHHNLAGIAAVGRPAGFFFGAAVGAHHAGGFAVLLQAIEAAGAGAAGIDHAAHTGDIAHFEVLHVVAHLGHTAHNFVAGHHWEDGTAPLVAYLVQVGVAHATELNVNQYIVWAHVAALEIERGQGHTYGRGRVGFSRKHCQGVKSVELGVMSECRAVAPALAPVAQLPGSRKQEVG